ncbi:amidophosphoribosyltransferase [Longimicrobium sp.]|uniref:amidophosphoribosyltransferase n=1 Tax=Longimicrobium sp. TaxID=2029185 RepID=UPI002C305EA9|nr:amidophosphoribosyltransferase [Longimicrobium sp.]HSU15829.1 amidophosphoribosyltransferase [Longimicrobium sp.]
MCGIVAVSGNPEAARLAYLGLYSLQHRGQEAAGIATFDRATGDSSRVREAGLVSDVFGEDKLDKLRGDLAVGHIRYSTAGGAGLKNAQPIREIYRSGHLALVHNGNLTNFHALRDRLLDEGAMFQSTIDSEIIVHLIARSREAGAEAQIIDALQQLEGAYCVLVSVDDALFAARDPFGYRPLVIGALPDGGLMVASETCALDIVKARYVRDVEPGEVIRIRGGEIEEVTRLPRFVDQPQPCIFELVYFARPDTHLWGYTVDRARRAFGRRLAQEQPAPGDIVISIPDSANSAAVGYAEASGIGFELGLIRNHYVGRTFITPTQAGRDFKVRLKFSPVREVLDGKRVVVVDDSLVRGTTSRALVQMLREAGASQVHLRLASPPVRWPCFYGIDMPTRNELIAAEKTIDEMREYLGVDSLGYLSAEGMIDCVRDHGETYCTACFTGDYKAPLVDAQEGFAMSSHC